MREQEGRAATLPNDLGELARLCDEHVKLLDDVYRTLARLAAERQVPGIDVFPEVAFLGASA
jgi:hypothetical protein